MQIEFLVGGRRVALEVLPTGGGYRVLQDGAAREATILAAGSGRLEFSLDGRRHLAWLAVDGDATHVCLAGRQHVFVRHTGDEGGEEDAAGGPLVTASLPGKVVKLLVAPGATVAAGAPLLILEAMKMETEVTAPLAGRVSAVRVVAGQSVALGDVLAEIAPPPGAGATDASSP